jgi:signal transduction histidine kinase
VQAYEATLRTAVPDSSDLYPISNIIDHIQQLHFSTFRLISGNIILLYSGFLYLFWRVWRVDTYRHNQLEANIQELREQNSLLLATLSDLPARQSAILLGHYPLEMNLVDQVVGSIAHYFNNMFTAIIGFTELSQNTLQANHGVQNNLSIIKETAQQAADIVKNLLAFTQQQFIRPEVLNVNTLLEPEISARHEQLPATVQMAVLLAPELGLVRIDPLQIRQLFHALVDNALEAMPDGGYLTIETANTSFVDTEDNMDEFTPGDYTMLFISDTGIGMTDTEQGQAFLPFFTTKKGRPHLGLGLSTCFGIARQNGGFISIHSETGRGTTVRVYLPQTTTPQ